MLLSTGGLSGYGCMVLSILNQEIPKEWILPDVRIDLFNRVLADFAEHFGIGKDKRVILVCDLLRNANAIARDGILVLKLKFQMAFIVTFLPAHSPELQPAERLWPLTNEAVANHSFETLEQLELVLFQRCRALLNHCDLQRFSFE